MRKKFAAAFVLTAIAACSQTFDAASIKPAAPGARGYSIRPLPGRLSVGNCTLRQMIAAAYHVMDFQVTGGPKWLDADRWDIEAKGEGDREAMLRALLAERFALKVHEEKKDLPTYTIELDKGGSKLQPSQGEGEIFFRIFQRRQIEARHAPLSNLTETLAFLLGRPVADKTGLTGTYDYKLQWSPDQIQLASDENAARPADPDAPSLTSALREQLGLRLTSQRGPVTTIVVDSAAKASAN